MLKGYMFFDDEIANTQGRICQIGYVLNDFEGNQVGEPVSQLIDPESEFEEFCVRVHGIREHDVRGMPTLRQFCDVTGFLNLLKDYVFVAHNAKSADLTHLRKSLNAYGIELPVLDIVDTMRMARNSIGVGGLKEACEHYGIEIDGHHDALSDARACRNLFWRMRDEEVVSSVEPWSASECGHGHRSLRRPIGGMGYVHGEMTSIEQVIEELELLGLRGEPESLVPLEGKRIVVTGRVRGYVGNAIEEQLEKLGAKTSSSVSKKTNLLVIGDNAGRAKIDKARDFGVPVITSEELRLLIRFSGGFPA